MLIQHKLFIILSILLSIGIFLGLSVFVKKKFNNYYGILIGLILSAFGFGAAMGLTQKVYMVNPDFTVNTYRLLGQAEIDINGGKMMPLAIKDNCTGLVNKSNQALVLEELYYSEFKPIDTGKEPVSATDTIAAYHIQELCISYSTIDYFFDDEIPETIKSHRQGHARYRLRKFNQ